MSRTKEFNCANVGPEEKPTPIQKVQIPDLPSIPSVDDDTISVGSDEITIGDISVYLFELSYILSIYM